MSTTTTNTTATTSKKTTTKKNVARKTATKRAKTIKNVKKTTNTLPVDQAALAQDVKQITGTKGVLVRVECHFPTNKDRRDTKATEEFHKDSHTVLQRIMKQTDPKTGKEKNYEEWDAVTTWKNKFNAFMAKNTLGVKLRGIDVISVHRLETFRNGLDELKAELPAIKQAIIDKMPEMKAADQIRLDTYFNESLYPTEEVINSWGLRSMFAELDPTHFPENADFLEEANRERYSRLVDSFGQMVGAITKYITGEKKSFRDNSIENLVQECEFLADCAVVDDDKIKKLCDTCKKIGQAVAVDELRTAKKKIETAKEGTDLTDDKALLEKTSETLQNSLDALKSECEGII